ncbi:3-dehydroquinate synthase [Planctomicrobium sp.]|jgi:3-dehydroquinate synthase|nr:3-dehydroquinate synthase [Planctomicrobium sp.]MBT5021032.1 3-dehydroquinate synthase [Planctomicrobium sp.]MDA7527746.1 3-dehydroquinate synthase [bacterium]MDB4743096.1 3-dehydroquinate synthase [Planctomicrobium sp.]
MSEFQNSHVNVNLNDRSYQITIGQHLLQNSAETIGAWLEKKSGKHSSPSAMIVTDNNVTQYAANVSDSLESAGWRTSTFTMEPGERSKRLEVISQAWDQLVEFKADRRTVVIAVGGGVVGDAAGFMAATFARGIPFVQIPTTLLADVDSSVGGKVGINHPQAKNLIGAFHQPLGVIIDTDAFKTLPERDYKAGWAEVIKYGVILDSDFFEFLSQNITAIGNRDEAVLRTAIQRSCELKAQVVEEDEYERTGLRAVLNYGHTYCHAFEALTGYGELLHGEAVSIGIVYASRLAEKMGRIEKPLTDKQIELLAGVGLPLNLKEPQRISIDDVIDRMKLDKKTVGGKLRFVLPTRIGHVELVEDVPEELVRETLIEGGLSGS